MSKLETIKEIARTALTAHSLNNGSDDFLWERGKRLVTNASCISMLPEIAGSAAGLDSFCLLTAAYFNDVCI